MAKRRIDSVLQLAEQIAKRPAHLVSGERVGVVRVAACPRPELTMLITVGLAAIDRSFYRGKSSGFELVAAVAEDLETISERLVAAVIVELDRDATGANHQRYNASPPRGVMYNGVFAAPEAPHLLFATDLAATPDLAMKRHAVGDRWVELLPAIPISDAELEAYDRSPPGLIQRLRDGRLRGATAG